MGRLDPPVPQGGLEQGRQSFVKRANALVVPSRYVRQGKRGVQVRQRRHRLIPGEVVIVFQSDDLADLSPDAEACLRTAFGRGYSLRRIRAAVEGAVMAGGGIGRARLAH